MLDLTLNWPRVPIASLDFETTGVDAETCAPVSVACVRFECGHPVQSFSSLLNPGCPIPEQATSVHGVTDEMVRDAPSLVDVAPQLLEVARDAVPCGYNAQRFDRLIMHRFISGTDCLMWDASFPCWLDVRVIIARHHFRGRGKQTLAAACSAHGVEIKAHNAASDATATGRLLYRLYERNVIKPCSMERLLRGVARAHAEQEAEFAAWKARQEEKEGAA